MMCKGENTIAAYIWAGFKASPCFEDVTIERGEIELCEAAVGYTPLLKEIFDYVSTRCETVWGVYEYEVAELFGSWLCESIASSSNSSDPLPSEKACKYKLLNLAWVFFNKEDKAEKALTDFFKQPR